MNITLIRRTQSVATPVFLQVDHKIFSRMSREQLPDWVESILSGYLSDTEEVVDSYTEKDSAIVISDRRLISVEKREDGTDVESSSLKGDHVIGSKIETKSNSYLKTIGWVVIGFGVALWLAVGSLWLLAGGILTGGILVLSHEEETVITIQTKQGDNRFTIPQDAEYLGKTVSRIIAEEM
jgi:hypothetical protein